MNQKIQNFLTTLGAYAFILLIFLASLYGAMYFFIKIVKLASRVQ